MVIFLDEKPRFTFANFLHLFIQGPPLTHSAMIPSDSKDQDKYTQIQLGLSDNVISALQYENILTSADSISHVKKCSIIQWIHYHVMAIRMDEMR